MYPAAFDYVKAASWSDAVSALAEGGEDARVIAGGQSLVPMMMLRLAEPSRLVDVAGAAERSIERREGVLVLSALVRHVDLIESSVVREAAPILAEAAELIGNVRVRHRGTIGGSLAHAEATAELPCVAVALGASVRALGPAGERAIPADELFVTHFTTALEPGEVITAVEFPVLASRQGSAFVEMTRRPGDFAMVEAAAVITMDDEGRCAAPRLVISATADRPIDVSMLAAPCAGERPDERLAREVGVAVAAEADVGPSLHGGAEYRRAMLAVLVKRAILTAAARAGAAPNGRQ
jgi:CO/xanthine dehydrogenase FAD-binding subunit